MTSFTLLLRQIHPSFVQKGRATSQAFRPTAKDEGKLSVYDGDQIQPQPAWEHYTQTLGRQSAGVMGIAVGQCASLDITVRAEPAAFPEHCVMDFSGLARAEVEKKAKLLAGLATTRGWLFIPRPGD